MPQLETIVLRSDDSRRTWRDRVGAAWRSLTLGPFNTKDRELARLFGSRPASSGETVTSSRALTVSAFWSAATMISADVASLPLRLYKRRRDGGKDVFSEHPLYRLLHDEPNPQMGSMQFRETLMLSALVTGNAFAEIERDKGGRPIALWPLLPQAVTPFTDGGALRYRVPSAKGGEVILSAFDMFHLRGPSADGLVGYDVVEQARETLGLALASEKYAGRFFQNFAQVGGVVSTTMTLTEPARLNLAKALEARHAGADRAHRLLLLENGLTYTPTSTNPRDSQFAELREHQIREIARYFRIPPAMIGDLSRATWSNYEQAQSQYYTQAIRPWLVRIEQELNRTVISSLERNLQSFEHSVEGFLRANTTERAAFYSALLDRGVMSINEARRLENLSPIAGGDVPRVPMNYEPLRAVFGPGIPAATATTQSRDEEKP